MRITSDLIQNSQQFTNRATTDRELRMRALKIPAIENLGATYNQFDCFDLSDNLIKKLENFPLLPRLKCLLLSNNRITKIAPNLQESIPNLERLILTNNYIQELGDIDVLSTLENIKVLSLINNPLTTKKFYRNYIIFKLPHLTLLDFSKVKPQERADSQALFSGIDGQVLADEVGVKSKNLGGSIDNDDDQDSFNQELQLKNKEYNKRKQMDDAEALQIDAQNQESIKRINNLIRAGHVPGSKTKRQHEEDLIENVKIRAVQPE